MTCLKKRSFPKTTNRTDAVAKSSGCRVPNRHLVIQNAIKPSAGRFFRLVLCGFDALGNGASRPTFGGQDMTQYWGRPCLAVVNDGHLSELKSQLARVPQAGRSVSCSKPRPMILDESVFHPLLFTSSGPR